MPNPITLLRSRSTPYVFINSDKLPVDLVRELDRLLSYHPAGFERTFAYQKNQWDGKVHLFRRNNKGAYMIPCGLTQYVKDTFDAWGIEYQFVCEDPQKYRLLQHESMTWNVGVALREYQQEVIDTLESEGYCGVVALPTAGGKTVCAAKIIFDLAEPVLILVHRKELLYQWQRELLALAGIDASLVGDGHKDFSEVTVAMVQSISAMIKNREQVALDFPMIIMDEAHTIPSDTAYTVAMACNASKRIGLSATPKREDGADLKIIGAIGRIVCRIGTDDLIKRGYLATPKFKMIRYDPVSVRTNNWSSLYKYAIVENIDRNEHIISEAERMLADGRQVYIHVAQIAHGQRLAPCIDGAIFCHASTKGRKDIIADFESGKIRCLVSTLLKEGVSINNISGLIYASGMKSEISTIQTIGRCLRMDEQFGNSEVIDFLDVGHRILQNHTQNRIEVYRNTYGDFFKY